MEEKRVKKFPSETTEIANSVFSILIQYIQLYIYTVDEWKQSRLTVNTVGIKYFFATKSQDDHFCDNYKPHCLGNKHSCVLNSLQGIRPQTIKVLYSLL